MPASTTPAGGLVSATVQTPTTSSAAVSTATPRTAPATDALTLAEVRTAIEDGDPFASPAVESYRFSLTVESSPGDGAVDFTSEGAIARDGRLSVIYRSAPHTAEYRSDGTTVWESDGERWTAVAATNGDLIGPTDAYESWRYMVLQYLAAIDELALGHAIEQTPTAEGHVIMATVALPTDNESGLTTDLVTRLTFDADGILTDGETALFSRYTRHRSTASWHTDGINEPFDVAAPEAHLITERNRESDEAQARLSNALTAAKVFYADKADYNAARAELQSIEPSVRFETIANADRESVGFATQHDGQVIVFLTQDTAGGWWCIADDARAGGATFFGSAERAAEIDTLEECSLSSW